MWIVRCKKQIVHCSRDFKLAYRMAKVMSGTLIYKPYEATYSRSN
jgi:hypothetical protein